MSEGQSAFLNGMGIKPFDELLAEARERYTTAISDAVDVELQRFLLPSDRVAVLEDAAMFVCFMLALKTAEVTTPFNQAIDAKDALRAWWPIEKRIKAEVGPMLLEYGKELVLRQLQGSAEAGQA